MYDKSFGVIRNRNISNQITINMDLETSKLYRRIKKLESEIGPLKTRIKKLENETKNTHARVNKLDKKLKNRR